MLFGDIPRYHHQESSEAPREIGRKDGPRLVPQDYHPQVGTHVVRVFCLVWFEHSRRAVAGPLFGMNDCCSRKDKLPSPFLGHFITPGPIAARVGHKASLTNHIHSPRVSVFAMTAAGFQHLCLACRSGLQQGQEGVFLPPLGLMETLTHVFPERARRHQMHLAGVVLAALVRRACTRK